MTAMPANNENAAPTSYTEKAAKTAQMLATKVDPFVPSVAKVMMH
jgi:hypothetical protein